MLFRSQELGDRTSRLNPLWYAGAFGIGLLAGRLGDKVSLGFVVETERQVEAHLASHLQRLPAADAERLLGKAIEHEYNLADLLRRPGVGFDTVAEVARLARPDLTGDDRVSRETLATRLGDARMAGLVIEQVEIATKYAGYIGKQTEEVERTAHFEHLRLPDDLDYAQVTALSFEVRQKLSRHRPETLGQATRISGVTPAAISLLLVHLKKGRFKGFSGQGDASAIGADDSQAQSAA